MGFELPIDTDYFDHPKTLHIIRILGDRADVYPLRLWSWASKYAREGVITQPKRVVEVAVKWSGPSKKLYKAFMTAGFIESDSVTIHDWMDHIGRAIAIYERKKAKQREKYNIEHGIIPEESGKTVGIMRVSRMSGKSSLSGRGDPTPPPLGKEISRAEQLDRLVAQAEEDRLSKLRQKEGLK